MMRSLLILILFLSFKVVSAQNLESHKWKNRVLLIFSETEDSEDLKTQLKVIRNYNNGFTERKLIIYQAIPFQYKLTKNGTESGWIKNKTFYNSFMSKDNKFKVVLIGLDGGIKLTKVKPNKPETLFSTIDKMPMRKSELRKN